MFPFRSTGRMHRRRTTTCRHIWIAGNLASLADQNPIEFESYRFDALDYHYGIAERTRLRRVA